MSIIPWILLYYIFFLHLSKWVDTSYHKILWKLVLTEFYEREENEWKMGESIQNVKKKTYLYFFFTISFFPLLFFSITNFSKYNQNFQYCTWNSVTKTISRFSLVFLYSSSTWTLCNNLFFFGNFYHFGDAQYTQIHWTWWIRDE